MLVDYRVRCETDTMIDGLPCRVIRYGVSKAESNAGLYCPAWYDVPSHFADYGGGRTTPSENESTRHFFNKRIMTDEEKNHVSRAEALRVLAELDAQTLQGDSELRSVGAPDGEGSTEGVEELQASVVERNDGGGDSRTGEEVTS